MSDLLNTQTLAVFTVFLFIWNIILTWRVFRPENKIDTSILPENSVIKVHNAILEEEEKIKKISEYIKIINTSTDEIRQIALRGIQNVGVVRFNPFKDVGGDQSFAIAFLDAKGNGLTLSSFYSREGTRIYAKPVKNMTSTYQLSQEEKGAIENAIGSKDIK